MKPIARRRPQPAFAISLLALFVALGGTSYAAVTITGKNVRNGSLSGTDIKDGSLRGKDVRDGSLNAGDLSPTTIASLRGSGPTGATGANGAKGATGATGATGAAGAPGTFGAVTVRTADYTSGAPAIASCLSGEVAVGGGVYTGQIGFVRVSAPSSTGTPVGWRGQTVDTANAAVAGTVYAICATR